MAKKFIKENVKSGLLLQRVGLHVGRTKAWQQEQLRTHISTHKQETENEENGTARGFGNVKAHPKRHISSSQSFSLNQFCHLGPR